jgi:hypothetical protein
MKQRSILFIIALALSASGAAWGGNGQGKGNNSDPGRYEHSVLSLAEAEALRFLREEEKLARDVYLTLYKRWSLQIFANISESEQTHMDAVKNLLDKYRVEDPVLPQVGRFTNSELQTAYDQLVAQGSESLMAALHVGGFIEELDIGDLYEAEATTSRDDILNVYANLMRGSRNHLRAFVGKIEDRGVVYEAQVLTQEEVDAIVDSPMERGL